MSPEYLKTIFDTGGLGGLLDLICSEKLMNSEFRIYTVYHLSSSADNVTRYIGKTYIGSQRHSTHKNVSRRIPTHKENWICKVLASGESIVTSYVFFTISESEALHREVFEIAKYSDNSAQLTNLTVGGDGVSGLIKRDSSKELQSKSISGTKNPANARRNFKSVTAFDSTGDPVATFESYTEARDKLGLYQTAVAASIRGHVRDVAGMDGVRYRFRKGILTESIGPTPKNNNRFGSLEVKRITRNSRIDYEVYAYNDTGELYRIFKNVQEASETLGLSLNKLHAVSRGKRIFTEIAGPLRIFRGIPSQAVSAHKDNAKHKSKPVRMLNEDGEVLRVFDSVIDAANFSGTGVSGIALAAAGKLRRSGGYKWEFINNPSTITGVNHD